MGDGGADAGSATAGRCPAGTESRPAESSDEPGYQCGIREGDRFVAQGPYARFWPGGAIKTEGTFDRGKRSGTWKTFDNGGQLREERSYREGELDGPARTWDASGVLTSDRLYRTGAPVGPDAGQ
jgi:antitoxin component YwqK of YwqJK toxin-antitoxin module